MGESKLRRVLCLLVLAGVLAACGGGGDDDESSGDGETDEETTTTAAEDDPAATGTTLGGDGATRTDDAQAYVDALVTATADGGGVSQSPDQNRCFSEAYVDTVGVEALADAIPAEDVADTPGISPDEIGVVMTPEQRDAFYVGLQRCIDVKGFFVGVFTTGVQMAEADVACLTGALDDGATKLMAVAAFDGDPAPIENDQGFIDLIARLTAACPAAMEAAGWA